MRWTPEAEEAVERVPFFVRKRVRKRVEEEAIRSGAKTVRREHVQRCKERYLNRMEDDVKGCQVETCFGPSGCPNRAFVDDEMAGLLEERISKRNWRAFLEDRVGGPLKVHHEFRVSVSDCPNACSRPQIADLGLLGAREPAIGEEPCNRCEACVEVCREGAVSLAEGSAGPVVDADKCLFCGQCIEVCPTGTLREGRSGYRIVVGGKLGRHPRLATPLEGIHERQQALDRLDHCLDFCVEHSRGGERLGEILNRVGWEGFVEEGARAGEIPTEAQKKKKIEKNRQS
ncbi:MAG: 4Fe-4S binding protein [Thermodesulfobacteriota bacterium]